MVCLRFSFSRGEELKYLSHLDLMRLFQRALRRAGIPVARSKGFNPRPRISLAVPLPVGVTADQEYGEICLQGGVPLKQFVESLNSQLPPGLSITGAGEAKPGARSLSAVVNAALYRATRPDARPAPVEQWREAAEGLLVRSEIMVNRNRGAGKIADRVNIRPYIFSLTVHALPATGGAVIEMLLQVGSRGGVSPSVVLQQLAGETGEQEELWRWQIHRRGLYIYGEELTSPLPGGGHYFWIRRSL